MSASTPTPDEGHRAKRLKLSQPKGAYPEGTARYRMSAEGLVEEPVGTRGPPRKSGSFSGRGKAIRASTGNMPSAAAKAAESMMSNIFPQTHETTPLRTSIHTSTNGLATTPTSTDTNDAANDSLSASGLAKRHVSGPGQFTPRALLKCEEDFADIGCHALSLLYMRGDGIAWWMAEQVLRIHRYLEHPQKGKPSTIDARPIVIPRGPDGKEVAHCCDKGGIEHLLPCNFKKPPTAKETFGFAKDKAEHLVMEHHASKGGINTIAAVGDIVLKQLVGEADIEEDEFKLLAGSEYLRQYHGKGHKRYKAPDPKVDPTKNPILLLKSFKKMAMNDEFVTALKNKYTWALTMFPHLVGEPSPPPEPSLEPSPVPAFAQRGAGSTPAMHLAPAPASAPPATSLKRPRTEHASPVAVKRITFKKSPEAYADSPALSHDARMSRRPEFPLHEQSHEESMRLAKAIHDVQSLIIDISDPMRAAVPLAPTLQVATKSSPKALSPSRRGGRGRGKRSSRVSDRGSDQISILLDATAGDAGDDMDTTMAVTQDLTSDSISRLAEPLRGELSLPVSCKLDGWIKTIVESVTNDLIDDYPEDVKYSRRAKAVVDDRLRKLERTAAEMELRINTVIDAECGRAISELYRFLVPKMNKARPKRALPASPTGQLIAGNNMI